jgi:regulator of protease activity HflC (stomatin/prohibitin superfamily)
MLKEAYTKAIGGGLAHSLSRFGFSIEDSRIQFHPPPDEDPAHWTFALFAPADRDRIALAIRSIPRRKAIIIHCDEGDRG